MAESGLLGFGVGLKNVSSTKARSCLRTSLYWPSIPSSPTPSMAEVTWMTLVSINDVTVFSMSLE